MTTRILIGASLIAFAAAPAHAGLLISEVAWMGSDASPDDEWIEIYNPDAQEANLSGYVIVDNNGIHTLPNVVLPAGGAIVVEARTQATSLADGQVTTAQPRVQLSNDNSELLRLCPSGVTDGVTCDSVKAAGSAWIAGRSTTPRATMERFLAADGSLSWRTASVSSTVTHSGGVVILGNPGDVTALAPVIVDPNDGGTPDAGDDAGELDAGEIDGGVVDPVDAGDDAGEIDAGDVDSGVVDPVDAGDDAGIDGGIDAGIPDFVYAGLAIDEVYYNPPGNGENGFEWIELANYSNSDIPLDGVVLDRLEGVANPVVSRHAVLNNTGIILAPNDRVVIAQSESLGLGICLRSPVVVLSNDVFSLANSGTQTLRVNGVRADGVSFENKMRYLGSGMPTSSATDGKSISLRSRIVDNNVASNWQVSSCAYGENIFGSPGNDEQACISGETPSVSCPVNVDGGVVVDGGVNVDGGVLVDGGDFGDSTIVDIDGNQAPALEVLSLTNDGTGYALRYNASDTDGDAVTVSLFYDVDNTGADGVRFASGLPGGDGRIFSWIPANMPAGAYHVFAEVTDGKGGVSYTYANTTVDIGGGVPQDAQLVLIEPDGVNDGAVNAEGKNIIRISWQATLPEGVVGSLRLLVDTDDEGEDGEPIAAGIPVGAEAPSEMQWDASSLPAGSYTVYAVLSWPGGSLSSRSPFFNVQSRIGCTSASGTMPWGLLALFGMIRILVGSRGRQSRRLTNTHLPPSPAPSLSSSLSPSISSFPSSISSSQAGMAHLEQGSSCVTASSPTSTAISKH